MSLYEPVDEIHDVSCPRSNETERAIGRSTKNELIVEKENPGGRGPEVAGVLYCRLVSASNIPKMDYDSMTPLGWTTGKADPYVLMSVHADRTVWGSRGHFLFFLSNFHILQSTLAQITELGRPRS